MAIISSSRLYCSAASSHPLSALQDSLGARLRAFTDPTSLRRVCVHGIQHLGIPSMTPAAQFASSIASSVATGRPCSVSRSRLSPPTDVPLNVVAATDDIELQQLLADAGFERSFDVNARRSPESRSTSQISLPDMGIWVAHRTTE